MKVKVKKSALVDFLKSKINEDVSSAEHNTILGIDIEDEGPIEPVEMMATQLAVERPPVGDPEFIPASISELANSASAIAQECPGPQLEWFYRKLHELLDVALDRQDAAERDGSVLHAEEEELRDLKSGDLAESLVRKFLRRKILSEASEDQIQSYIRNAVKRMSSPEDADQLAYTLSDISGFEELEEFQISAMLVDAFYESQIEGYGDTQTKEPEQQEQPPEEEEEEDEDVDDGYEDPRGLEEPITMSTKKSRAIEDATQFFLENKDKYVLDLFQIRLGSGKDVVPFDVRFAKNSTESEAVVDSVISDLKNIGTFGDNLDAIKDHLENYVLSFLKDPEKVLPKDLQIGDANAIVDTLIKKHEGADSLDEFLQDAEDAAVQAEELGRTPFYIRLIASDYYLTRDEPVEDTDEYFGEEGEELSDEEVAEIRKKFREESRQQALDLEFSPGSLVLSNKALRALMEEIADDMGTGLGNVRNVVYDDLKMMGMDMDILKKRMRAAKLPGGREAIPSVYDPLLVMAAESIIDKSYELFRYSLDRYVEDLDSDEADEFSSVFSRAYEPGIEGYMRLQDMSGGEKIDDPENFRRTRKAFEAVQIFLDELAKEMVPDSQKEAKEGGIRAFMLNIKDSGALEEDRRDDFDEFLAKKIKGFDGFKRDEDFLISAIDTALSKSEKRAARYIKQLEKEKAGREKKQMAELSKLIDSVI